MKEFEIVFGAHMNRFSLSSIYDMRVFYKNHRFNGFFLIYYCGRFCILFFLKIRKLVCRNSKFFMLSVFPG